LLQVARSAALTGEPAGIAALNVLSRWVPYQVYRLSARWPNARPELVRLISFVLLSLMIVCSLGLSILLTWSALTLLLWNILRARRDIYAGYDSAGLTDALVTQRPSAQNPPPRTAPCGRIDSE
jgi:hypothetical protein